MPEDDLNELKDRVDYHKEHFILTSDALSVMNDDLGNDLLMLETIAPAILLDEVGFLPGYKETLKNNGINVVKSVDDEIYQYYLVCEHFTFGVGFN